MGTFTHTPVLLRESLALLRPAKGERVLDVTLGLGGHAVEFLKAIGDKGEFVGLDADAGNLAEAETKLRKGGKASQTFLHANFGDLASLNLEPFDVIFADLGLSSPHVDDPARGFTYRSDAPLDLRFDRTRGKTAWELLVSQREPVVAQWLREYGELRQAGRLARELCKEQPRTTGEVKAIVEQISGRFAPSVLPLVFQALRIAVNDELTMLDRFLRVLPSLLKIGGRAGIMSYHSLEDRRVKQLFRVLTTPPRDAITGADREPAEFSLLTKKPIIPGDNEVSENPRSRSAKLRGIRREQRTSVVQSAQ